MRPWLIWALLVIAGCVQSCSTLEKRISKAKVIAYENPSYFADFCSKVFPVKDSIGEPIIKYVPADNKDYSKRIDSIHREVDAFLASVRNDTSTVGKMYRQKIENLSEQLNSFRKEYRKCVPDTVKVELPVWRENTARLAYVAGELSKMTGLYQREEVLRQQAEKSRSTWMWVAIGSILIGLVSVFFNVKKFFR